MNVENIAHYILLSGDWEQLELAYVLALVSKKWLRPVRRLLFARPKLTSHHACTLLARSCTTSPALAKFVRMLDLRFSDRVDPVGVFRLLQATPNLEALTLHGVLARNAERYLRFIPYPNKLASLRISYSDGTYEQKSELIWDGDFDIRFANLKSLDLRALRLRVPEDYDDHSYFDTSSQVEEYGPRIRLNYISLREVYVEESVLSRILSTGSWDCLRTLKIASVDVFTQGKDITSILQSNPRPSALKTLHLEELGDASYSRHCRTQVLDFGDDDERPVINAVTRLVLLYMKNLSVAYEVLESPSIFPNIEVLTIDAGVLSREKTVQDNAEWIRSVKGSEAKNLKTIELFESDLLSANDLSLFRDACQECGIEVVGVDRPMFYSKEGHLFLGKVEDKDFVA